MLQAFRRNRRNAARSTRRLIELCFGRAGLSFSLSAEGIVGQRTEDVRTMTPVMAAQAHATAKDMMRKSTVPRLRIIESVKCRSQYQ